MKSALYIGIYTYGSTSKMRADKMRGLLPDWNFEIIDTDVPYEKAPHILKSLAFRYKIGPLIRTINQYVISNLQKDCYDLIWVDKAIFITKETTKLLRKKAKVLVHYTPDPAFTFHKSKHFYASMPLYDFMITTKSYEINDFLTIMKDKNRVIYCTQGFDKNIHRPIVAWENKKGVGFIGHHEVSREEPVKALLQAGVDVLLAGRKWESFVDQNNYANLHYIGGSVEGEDYVKAISSCLLAWGAVSKWIPEKHTTRTFEIPACKTALLTERNSEIESFFSDEDVIFYNDIDDMVFKVKYYLDHKDELQSIVENGYNVVQTKGFDFESIMRNLLAKVLHHNE